MTDNFVVTPSATPDADVAPNSFADGLDHCLTCGVSLIYGGRGRRPKYCDEHHPNKNKGNGSPRATQSMKALEESLTELYQFLGMGVGLFDEFSGMVIADKADTLASSWISLANTNPKVKKFLIKMTTGSGAGAVVVAHAMVAMPIMAHHNMLPTFLNRNTVASDT